MSISIPQSVGLVASLPARDPSFQKVREIGLAGLSSPAKLSYPVKIVGDEDFGPLQQMIWKPTCRQLL